MDCTKFHKMILFDRREIGVESEFCVYSINAVHFLKRL